jgi:hypothetical protein
MQSSRSGVGGIRRFLPYLAAILIVYGAVGVAVNLRLVSLLVEGLTGWFGPQAQWSAFVAPLQVSIMGPLEAHFDARPWLPWAAWLVGTALFPLFPGRSTALQSAVDHEGAEEGTGEAQSPAARTRLTSILSSRWTMVVVLLVLLVIGGVGRMVELWPQSYGLTRYPYDDEGVYAGAAQLFLQGALPYRDYFFAHPPIAAISYAPAMLYHFTEWGSPTSFMMARYLSVFYSLVTLALIFFIAYKLAGLWGGAIAGLLWAVDGRVVEINRKIMLEGPLVMLSCGAILIYLWARPALQYGSSERGPRRPMLVLGFAGVVASLSALTKIAGLACLMAILGDMVWLWFENRRSQKGIADFPLPGFGRQLLALGLGVLASVLVALAPFFLAAPSQFIRMVIFFQLLRPSDGLTDTPSRIADITSSLGNALTPLLAAAGFIVLSIWAWLRRTPGPWRIGIIWTFFSLLLFTYSRSFYQHYYIQLAAPLCMLGAGVSLVVGTKDERRRTKDEGRSKLALFGNPPSSFVFRPSSFVSPLVVAAVSLLVVVPLLAMQWAGLVTRDCPHCNDPLFEVVGRYVNNAVPPGTPVLSTDEQFNILAARPPSRSATGYLIDSYGHMIFLGLNLGNRDWGDLISDTLHGERSDDAYAVMHLPAAQADILDRARQAAMIVIHDKGFPRLTPDTIAALAKIAKIDQQQSRYTIYRR